MAQTSTPVVLAAGEYILGDILDEYSGKLDISGQSRILISNSRLADVVKERFPGETGQWQPIFTCTSDVAKADGSGVLQGPSKPDEANLEPLEITSFTHAIISLNVEDGRAAFRMLKWVHWALIYKGLLIVVVPTKDTIVDSAYSIAGIKSEEVMWQKTPARPPILDHALRKASFEPGRIRLMERRLVTKKQADIDRALAETRKTFEDMDTSKVKEFEDAADHALQTAGGLLQEAYVILARKWDQLSA